MSISKKLSRHRIKRLVLVAVVILFIAVGALMGVSYWVGYKLAHPAHLPLSSNPAWWGMRFHNVEFNVSTHSLRLKGWWIPAIGSDLTVIMTHGYRNNRVGHTVPQLAVARALHVMGANVLMFDFRGSGDSAGHLASVGIFEQRDILAADHAVLTRWRPKSTVVLLGYSMGASSALMAAAEDPRVAGVIADSPFADLTQYLKPKRYPVPIRRSWRNLTFPTPPDLRPMPRVVPPSMAGS